MSLLMLFLTILFSIFCVVKIIYGFKTGNREIARLAFVRLASGLVIYALILLAVSITSNERVLGFQKEKRFCGCYLDCHLSAAVIDVEQSKEIKNDQTAIVSQGNFLIVTIKVTNKARYSGLKLNSPRAIIIDANKNRYQRDLSAEFLLAQDGIDPLTERIPANSSATRKIVFDLPSDVKRPYLSIKENDRLTRASELFIIGDEDSLLHKETKFFVMPPARIIFQDDEM